MRKGRIPLMLVGAALLASLTTGVVLAVMHLYAEHRGFAGAIDPRLVVLGSVAANAALLFALFRLGRFERESITARGDEA